MNKELNKKHNNIPPGFPYAGEVCFLEGSTNLNDYLLGGFDDSSRNILASKVLKILINKYGNPNCGRNRATFISKKIVIKFPLNDSGEINNLDESEFKSSITAKTKLINLLGFSCCIQEKLKTLDYPLIGVYPAWTKLIDSGQVGYNQKNELKSYDFAENIKELNSYLFNLNKEIKRFKIK